MSELNETSTGNETQDVKAIQFDRAVEAVALLNGVLDEIAEGLDVKFGPDEEKEPSALTDAIANLKSKLSESEWRAASFGRVLRRIEAALGIESTLDLNEAERAIAKMKARIAELEGENADLIGAVNR